MGKSSEHVKTESIRSKEYVYGVSNFWDPFGPSLDQVGTMFSLPLLLSIFLTLTVMGGALVAPMDLNGLLPKNNPL